MHLFGFVIRIYHDARSLECKKTTFYFIKNLSVSSDIIGITKEKYITDCGSEGVEGTATCFVQFVEEGNTVYWHGYSLY